jgi:hypothetical protein
MAKVGEITTGKFEISVIKRDHETAIEMHIVRYVPFHDRVLVRASAVNKTDPRQC